MTNLETFPKCRYTRRKQRRTRWLIPKINDVSFDAPRESKSTSRISNIPFSVIMAVTVYSSSPWLLAEFRGECIFNAVCDRKLAKRGA